VIAKKEWLDHHKFNQKTQLYPGVVRAREICSVATSVLFT
jgi:hypothetical protein